MDSEQKDENLALLAIAVKLNRKKKRTYSRNVYVSAENLDRNTAGAYATMVPALRDIGVARHYQYFRMTSTNVDELFNLIGTDIAKKLNHQLPIPAELRMMIALRYLGSGDQHIGLSTVREIIHDVCDAIVNRLRPLVLKKPTEDDWKAIAAKFESMWNFPYCCGAVDGKHVRLRNPPRSGSIYYNYKGYFSIILMALVDAEHKFIAVDIGAPGGKHDSSIFGDSVIGKQLANGTLDLPAGEYQLPNSHRRVPHVFIGDAAFPLQAHMMRPYPGDNLTVEQQIFNYRLCRARRIVESGFGSLASKWLVLSSTIQSRPEEAILITYACICLHNWLIEKRDVVYAAAQDSDDRSNRPSFDSVQQIGVSSHTRYAFDVRERFKLFFNNEGKVDWQGSRVSAGRY